MAMSGGLYQRYVPPRPEDVGPIAGSQPASGRLNAQENDTRLDKLKTVRKPKKRKLEHSTAVTVQEDDREGVPRSKQHQNILSKFDKSIKVSERLKQQEQGHVQPSPKQVGEDVELHDLVPLPQPPSVKREPYKPDFSSLPAWLSKPILADHGNQVPFTHLNLSPKVLANLKKRKYEQAFSVQSTLIPLLLPGPKHYYGDVCVSAPTGSGKTLAYVLPLIECLKDKVVTDLRSVIVVPTRELVIQVRQEAERCAAGTNIRVGTAVGSTNLVAEREQLIARDQRFDPEASQKLQTVIEERLNTGFMEDDTLLEDAANLLPYHVPNFRTNVDILICTPGRLVDHIRTTAGFSLRNVKHLVIDEADRLLDESFQEWVALTLAALNDEPNHAVATTNRLLQQPKFVQKIILSATMTQDLAKLAVLRLQRPTLVAVTTTAEGEMGGEEIRNGIVATNSIELLQLPANLQEKAIPVADGAEKPVYLLQLLTADLEIERIASQRRILIFTNNNEDALRLSHLLSSMSSSLASQIGVLTKTTTKSGRKTLSTFKSGKISVLIASDRASRGLDIPDLTDVISYDMPKSETLYIHRVGRTARAGQTGASWTFFTDTQARWFWNSIARTPHIQRAHGQVERYKILIPDSDDLRTRYASALESLKDAVFDNK